MKKILLILFICLYQLGGSQSIYDAIINNDTLQIIKISKNKKNLETISDKFGTPLMAAVNAENIEIIELLINKGVDVNEGVSVWWPKIYERYDAERRTKRSRTGYSSASDIAVEKGNIEILRLLIKNGAKLKARFLLKSVKSNDYAMLEYLVGNGILKISDSDKISKSIINAYLNNNTVIADYILNNMAENDVVYSSVFLFAIKNNKPDLLDYFFNKKLEQKTDIYIKPSTGGNYSNFAAKNDFSIICKRLIVNGMNPNVQDAAGYTSLDYAIINKNEELVEFLKANEGKTSFNLLNKINRSGYILFYDGIYVCEQNKSLFYANIKFNEEGNHWGISQYRNKGSLYFTGFYKDKNLTVKTDTFKFYSADSSLYLVEIFDNNKLVSRNCPGDPDCDDNTVYIVVNKMPEFPGGKLALRKWIANNLRYPSVAQECGIGCTIFLRFEVQKNGLVGRIELQKGCDPLLDEIAVETIKKLPRFTPGFHKGIPVNVWYSIPVSFKLN